jgi:hypothetical protein
LADQTRAVTRNGRRVRDEGSRFVSDVAAAFDRASAALQSGEWWSSIGGFSVRIRVAGSELARRFGAALVTSAPPANRRADLEVGCWDRADTGVAPPPPPWSLDDFLPRGRIRGYVHPPVQVVYDTSARMLSVYDRDRAEAFVHVADANEVPTWVDRAPLRSILTWWAADRDLAFLHASAVADEACAVVLAGASGSGKSTTALACVANGMRFVGDDACVVRFDPGQMVYPVYRLAKLEPDALDRLPSLARLAVDTSAEQIVLDPSSNLAIGAPLRAVLLPKIARGRSSRLTPTSPRAALRTLVPGSLLEGDGAGGTALRALTRLVQTAPCYQLELGSDLADVVANVRRALLQP